MKKEGKPKTKKVSISLDKEIFDKIDVEISNRSKFVQWIMIQYLNEQGISVDDLMF